MRQARVLPPLLSLRAFESAARQLSFSKAADELCVTQSAVSRHVRNLEEFLQRRLFVRQGRFINLSEDGQRYYERISAGFGLIEDATSTFLARSRSSVLTLDVLPTLGMSWLAPRLHHFSQRHPGVEIHLISSIEPVNFQSGLADIAIRVGKPRICERDRREATEGNSELLATIDLQMLDDWQGIIAEPLFPDTLVAVYNPRLVTPPASVEDLLSQTLISTTTRARAWGDWFKLAGIDNPKPKKMLPFGHFFMSLQAALDGRGIAILPEVLVEREFASGNIKQLFHKAESAGGYYLLYRKEAARIKKVAQFRKWIVQTSEDYRSANAGEC